MSLPKPEQFFSHKVVLDQIQYSICENFHKASITGKTVTIIIKNNHKCSMEILKSQTTFSYLYNWFKESGWGLERINPDVHEIEITVIALEP
jgi:hypothetical protein